MRDLGYRAELEDTADGPYISSAMEGLNFSVTFYHCAEEGRCGSLLLETGFVLETTIPYETMNGWNEAEFMGRAYLAQDGDPLLEHFVVLSSGLTAANFEEVLGWWGYSMDRFADHVGC